MVLRFLHPALFAVGFLPSLQIRSPTRISYPIKSSRHPYAIRSIQLARKRLIEKTKKEDGTLVVIRDGKVVHIPARELR